LPKLESLKPERIVISPGAFDAAKRRHLNEVIKTFQSYNPDAGGLPGASNVSVYTYGGIVGRAPGDYAR